MDNMDDFFSSFEDLEEELGISDKPADAAGSKPEPAKSSPAPAESKPAPAESAAAPAVPQSPAGDAAQGGAEAFGDDEDFDFGVINEDGSISFIEDAKKDIDALLSEFRKPAESDAPEAPAGGRTGTAAVSPAGEGGRSVFFAPEAGTGFDIADLPAYVLGDDDDTSSGAEDNGNPAQAASDDGTAPVQPEADSENNKEDRAAAAAGKKKDRNTGETIRKTVFVLAIITIIVSLGVLAKLYMLDPYLSSSADQKAANELIEEKELPSGTTESKQWKQLKEEYPDVEFAPDMQLKYAKLYAANPDLAGWISIDAFGINMPLAQGEDNDYYLKRNIYKKSTTYGVPFIDYRNDLYFLDRNTIVFGHNMRYSDKIFGMLEDYKTIDGFKRAPVIRCNTIYEDYTWKVYAVFVTNSEPIDDNGYVFNYTFTKLRNDKFMKYIEEVDERALYKTGVDICETDQILTLSTCCYDFDSAKLVVIARLLRDGESAEVDTSLAETNPNPRYPQAWYDANKKSNPYANADNWYA